MKTGILSLGEALIDFIPLDDFNQTYQKSPGGAPANVAVGLAQLGAKSTFLGKVGDDVLGRFLKETLHTYGVDTTRMFVTPDVRTGVVFVTNAKDGERSFDFYIDPSADRFLQVEDIEKEDFTHHKILHFGSISMITEPSRSATQHAVQLAKKNGMIISYDPNIRLVLWRSVDQAKETIVSMLEHVDVLKLSEEELTFITGEHDIQQGLKKLVQYDISLILITLGAKGSYVVTKEGFEHVPARKVKAIDTTGAGDAYMSGILYSLDELEEDIKFISMERAVELARFASISGALAASTKGAMTALPTLEELKTYLNEKGE